MKTVRGVTLLELLVACTLTTLILGMAYSLLSLARQSWGQVSSRASAAVNAEVSLERLRRDMQDSSDASVTSLPNAVGFASARDASLGLFRTDGTGGPAWQGYVVYYVDSQAVLRERQTDLPGSLPVGTDALKTLCDGTGRGVAYGIARLALVLANHQATLDVTSGPVALQATFPLRNSP